jgi:hypothetical protein
MKSNSSFGGLHVAAWLSGECVMAFLRYAHSASFLLAKMEIYNSARQRGPSVADDLALCIDEH